MNEKDFSINEFHIPRWNELPDTDLFLEQLVTLINSTLSPYFFLNNDKKVDNTQVLTKTMINNYVKNHLIEAPKKKQYAKIQVAKLFVICILKLVYSMQDIKTLIGIALENCNPQKKYNSFCNLFEKALVCTFHQEDFIDTNTKNSHLLKYILLSCSYKIYVQHITLVRQKTS